jgi:hypothetical protein
MVKPHNSTFGLRVRSTTINSGTMNIRSSVNEFGKFIGVWRHQAFFLPLAAARLTIDSASS